eukprot:TRINITY_DN38740_c0_g1_i1.p1 TRINITY_DN38740_c0_g1~~TRINITY_DN38740_c0_g1_i1.p1  ORF type:complete len:375 (+),score=78.81 TRINITY_DN38740_c0_g1_i1:74-1126(+)
MPGKRAAAAPAPSAGDADAGVLFSILGKGVGRRDGFRQLYDELVARTKWKYVHPPSAKCDVIVLGERPQAGSSVRAAIARAHANGAKIYDARRATCYSDLIDCPLLDPDAIEWDTPQRARAPSPPRRTGEEEAENVFMRAAELSNVKPEVILDAARMISVSLVLKPLLQSASDIPELERIVHLGIECGRCEAETCRFKARVAELEKRDGELEAEIKGATKQESDALLAYQKAVSAEENGATHLDARDTAKDLVTKKKAERAEMRSEKERAELAIADLKIKMRGLVGEKDVLKARLGVSTPDAHKRLKTAKELQPMREGATRVFNSLVLGITPPAASSPNAPATPQDAADA